MQLSLKLRRVLVSFVAVWAAYLAYSLVAVPWIEPTVSAAGSGMGEVDERPVVSPTQAYHGLLRRCFGEGSWVLGHPKLIESEQGMLLIKDYESLRPEAIEIHPFAMIFFPHPDVRTDPARFGEAVVLEAPRAVLEFDRPLDLSRARIGNLRGGRLSGQVTIRSDQKLPTPDDDLWIATRDVVLDQQKAFTPEPVEFRLGPNFGSGRELLIRLLAKDGVRTGGRRGPNIGGVQYIELVRDVRMQFELAGPGLLPGNSTAQAAVAAPRRPPPPSPPVRITSQGPFRLDLNEQEATFRDQVRAVRLNPDGRNDELSCEQLAIGFESRAFALARKEGDPPAAHEPGAKRQSPAITARRLRARGNPVVVQSPSTGAAARCQSLEYDLKTRQVQFEDAHRVLLNHRHSRIEAPKLSYQPGEGTQLGIVEALGPGELATLMQDDPQQPFRARWSRELRLRPHEGQPLLSVLGQAKVDYAQAGGLAADEIWMWLKELPSGQESAVAGGTRASTAMSKTLGRVVPDRMLAVGNVRIDSPQLYGDPDRFEVWFHQIAPQQGVAEAVPAEVVPAVEGREAATGRFAGHRRDRVAADAPRDASRPAAPPARKFEVHGKLLRLKVVLGDSAPAVRDVVLAGQARFVETRTAEPHQPPFDVAAEEVQVFEADRPQTRAVIVGQPARVSAHGMTMTAPEIQVDRGRNLLWIDRPGAVTLAMDRDLRGHAAPRAPATITWQKRLTFDGSRVRFEGDVEARTATQRLATGTLDVFVTPAVDFVRSPSASNFPTAAANTRPIGPDAASGSPPPVRVARIVCHGPVHMESRSLTVPTDGGAPQLASIERLQTSDLSIDQETGDIRARGPGWVRVARQGFGGASGGALVPGSKPQPVAKSETPDPRFTFLQVTYERGIAGHVQRRELTFFDQVRCVYGPVRSWDEQLLGVDVRQLGPDVVAMRCDQLTLAQPELDRMSGRSPMELAAVGNARVEGNNFTADAHRITYTEAKDLLILEGAGRKPAELKRQLRPGASPSTLTARKILFWRGIPRVDIDDIRLNVGQLGEPEASAKRR